MKKKKRSFKYKNIFIVLFICALIAFGVIAFIPKKSQANKMIDLSNMNVEQIKEYAKEKGLKLTIKEKHHKEIAKGKIISQNIKKGVEIKKDDELIVIISLGKVDKNLYKKYKVDELGNVPIMMYHGIHNLKNDDTAYIGGNVDKSGYQRTAEAFRKDLEFYYQNNYQMIRLIDYVNGIIDVELGKSPIILTFDDGLKNNILVTGLDEEGNIIIDPNSAVGILESFKKKYPDFNVTATFFLNGELFGQPEYNEKIIKWLINNGYDIGNHSFSHSDFTTISSEKVEEEIGKLYNKLDKIIPDKYVNVVALPFGSPYNMDHPNFAHILKSTYNGVTYETISTLQVGWKSELSPFNKDFNPLFLKRIRAYDNLGEDFDIEYNFKLLEKTRYISDGDKDTIVIPKEKADSVYQDTQLEIIEY
ncbi:MAG: polysaccharide deacetylase family protein [Mollicutes bacterium]|nr:polysaccharide deacetylase family protein [Mollicutes bacterium]